MEIAFNDWRKFKNRLSAINKKAADEMSAWINKRGGYDNIPRDEILNYAYGLATKYGEASATLSALMYDAVADLSKASLPAAIPADTATFGEVSKAIQGAAKFSKNTDYLAEVVGRLVKQAGADTTLQNALRDGAQFAWIPSGDTCMFCLTLASRGWQYASKDAIKNGHAEHIHSNCDCTYAVRFNENTNVGGYNPDEYLRLYESADGYTSKDKINDLRRRAYAINKDKINEQKRISYAERVRRLEDADELNVN